MVSDTEVCYKAVDKWGKDKQLDMAVEELSELVKAIVKYRRHEWNAVWRIKVLEEVADVELMCLQLRQMLTEKNEYRRIYDNKVENLMRIIENDDPMRGLKEGK